ncbi:sodium:proton antiporter [Thalassomonas sp. RHCl1]|uniref:cation:proton antiporter n=1 Tax=Thalassomonas sp. RHCl1 TaxID=2995320 RepID=UPI00248CF5DE|nr:sodium:proton antiporter [Thalassomonas sp. RHCl1]
MTAIEIIGVVLIFAVTGITGLMVIRVIKIPYSLALVLLGFILSFSIEIFDWDSGIRASNFQDLMLFVLLPVLIFEAAFVLDSKLLFKFLPNVLTLATIGLLLSTVLTAVLLFYGIGHPGFPFIAALITGAVVSATDPVAVVAQLKALKAPAELNVLIEGESLFNDATAIALFTILVSIGIGAAEPDVISGLVQFLKIFFGGILVGMLMGCMFAFSLRLLAVNVPALVLVSLVLAYGSFYIGEHFFHVSGIVAVLFAAIAFKRLGQQALTPVEDELHSIWESIGFIANVFVFVLLGLVVSVDMFTERWLAIGLAVIAATVARFIAVYSSTSLNRFTLGQTIDPRYPPIMIWGGLRGAVTIALVLSLPTELPYWWTIQSIGFGVVLFTLIVQATTNPLLVKRLKI